MKILITGINGLVGRGIAEFFYNKDKNEIIGIGRNEICIHEFCNKYIKANITNENLADILKKLKIDFTVIIHCAAALAGKDSDIFNINSFGTYNMLKTAKILNCKKFIYISSISVIGKPETVPITEEHKECPITSYQYSKYLGEQILKLEKDIDIYIFRIASPISIYTPKEKILPVFIYNCINNKDIVLYGKGERIQNYIDIRDIAMAASFAVKKENTRGLYNIVGENISNIQLAEICRKILKSNNSIRFENDLYGCDNEKWIVSGEKAFLNLGYEPKFKIENIIKDFVNKII